MWCEQHVLQQCRVINARRASDELLSLTLQQQQQQQQMECAAWAASSPCYSQCISWNLLSDAWFPSFHFRPSVIKFRCSVKKYVRKFRSVTAVNSKNIRKGSANCNGNGIRKRQRPAATAKRQQKKGNGMVEIGHESQRQYHVQRQTSVNYSYLIGPSWSCFVKTAKSLPTNEETTYFMVLRHYQIFVQGCKAGGGPKNKPEANLDTGWKSRFNSFMRA